MSVRQSSKTARTELLHLLHLWLRRARLQRKNTGFTLIEILVAIIIAALVITPLLGLAVNLLQTDRQEEAKATSEQELQAAADYIARDLQQSVFIYDAKALTRNHIANDPDNSGIRNQIPPVTGALEGCVTNNCLPVLVFWKRRSVADAVPAESNGDNCTSAANRDRCDDTFIYSLVAYYLIFDNPADTNVWSSTARIARFEITDGVRYQLDGNGGSQNNLIPDASARVERSPGFNDPITEDVADQSGSALGKLNRWTKEPEAFATSSLDILVDYIDQSPPAGGTTAPPGLTEQECPDAGSIPNTTPPEPLWTKSPDSAAPIAPADRYNDSFFACINRTENAVQVYLRGNALARIRPENNPPEYSDRNSSYFPTARIEVRGVGRLIQ